MLLAPAVALSVAAFIAGHPTPVACDVPEPAAVSGFTADGVIHLRTQSCEALARRPVTMQGEALQCFASGVATLIHEAAHVKGVGDESCAEQYADLGVFDVLRRFYAVRFFTPLSWRIGAMIEEESSHFPPEFRPTWGSCPVTGSPSPHRLLR